MDLFESDLPLVVTLFPVHGNHGIERRSICESKFLSIFDGFLQMLIPVDQKVPCNFFLRGTQIERDHIGFCIPVGTSSILFPGKTLGTNVQSFIFSCISLVQLEDIKADPLLGCGVPFNDNIRMSPVFLPDCNMLLEECIKSHAHGFD